MPLNQVGTVGAAGAAHAHRAGLGQAAGRRGGEGDPQLRPRPQPGGRRPDRAGADPAADRPSGARSWPSSPHKYAEGARIAVRDVRRDGMEQIKALREKARDRRGRGQDLDRRGAEAHRPVRQKGRRASRTRKRRSARSDRDRMSTSPNPIAASRTQCRGRRPGCRPHMSPSSWTATAAGPRRAVCRASPAIARARGGAAHDRGGDRRQASSWLTLYALQQRELAPAGRRGARPDRPAAAISAHRDRRADARTACGSASSAIATGSTADIQRDLREPSGTRTAATSG